MKNVIIDEDACVGCGACVEIAGDVFEMGPEDKARVYGMATEDNRDRVGEAIETCPVQAISWEE